VTGLIVLSPDLAQNNALVARAFLVWTLKYSNEVPELDTHAADLAWVEHTLYMGELPIVTSDLN
jgi:hypothetical protein